MLKQFTTMNRKQKERLKANLKLVFGNIFVIFGLLALVLWLAGLVIINFF